LAQSCRRQDLTSAQATGAFSCAAGMTISASTTPKIDTLMRRLIRDYGQASAPTKLKYGRKRPFVINGKPRPLAERYRARTGGSFRCVRPAPCRTCFPRRCRCCARRSEGAGGQVRASLASHPHGVCRVEAAAGQIRKQDPAGLKSSGVLAPIAGSHAASRGSDRNRCRWRTQWRRVLSRSPPNERPT
jgi:hypothetical protein